MVLDIRNIDSGQAKVMLGRAANAKKSGKNSKSNQATDGEDDSVELTGLAGQISKLVEQMKAAPALNPDRVSPVKNKLEQNQYEIRYKEVANKLLDFESAY